MSAATAVRRRLIVRGVVQGVGFRPHVARLARQLDLHGECWNDATCVLVEVEGTGGAVDEFARCLVADAPPLARIDDVQSTEVAPGGPTGFRITPSTSGAGARTVLPPDTAVCGDCLRELSDPDDRRYRHPFITCTNCGPRLSIGLDMPYDRPATTMRAFPMCAACAAEYADLSDRRYHAQPIACHDCGPVLELAGPDGTPSSRREAALAGAVRVINDGGIVAVKGIGGYHLACDARDEYAVTRLRERKQRPDRPFAVMVPDLQAVREIAVLPEGAEAVLESPQRPIVLLPAREGALAAGIAPGLDEVGVVLPYAPLHHLLLRDLRESGDPALLVMTSANAAGEPLCYQDDDAVERLADIADAILRHDRPIAVPVEDSVLAWSDQDAVPVRRSRGYAPMPIELGEVPGETTVLAAGAELKNTVVLARQGKAYLSAHVGDLESLAGRAIHAHVADQLVRMHGSNPALVVCDRHPSYASRAWAHDYARQHGTEVLEVQHHHAHLAALAAEHQRLDAPLLGLVFDGTGYGCDAGVWGGELLLLRDGGRNADRLGHLGDVRLAGGDAGVRNPARTAALALLDAGIEPRETGLRDVLSPAEHAFLARCHESGEGLVSTSSVGRLFDVVASLLGVRHRISYEAQAAIELEATARRWLREHPGENPATLSIPITADNQLDPRPLVRELVSGLARDVERGELAAAFHQALGQSAARLAAGAAQQSSVRTVGLTGGVFVNRVLLAATSTALRAVDLEVLTHRIVPANDGGLALGQAAIGVRTQLHEASQPS